MSSVYYVEEHCFGNYVFKFGDEDYYQVFTDKYDAYAECDKLNRKLDEETNRAALQGQA